MAVILLSTGIQKWWIFHHLMVYLYETQLLFVSQNKLHAIIWLIWRGNLRQTFTWLSNHQLHERYPKFHWNGWYCTKKGLSDVCELIRADPAETNQLTLWNKIKNVAHDHSTPWWMGIFTVENRQSSQVCIASLFATFYSLQDSKHMIVLTWLPLAAEYHPAIWLWAITKLFGWMWKQAEKISTD